MPSAKVSSRRRITIPSEACRRLGIEPGDRLAVEVCEDSLILRRVPPRASQRLWALGRGMYGPDPVAYTRQLRDELEEDLGKRERVASGDVGGSASEVPPRTPTC